MGFGDPWTGGHWNGGSIFSLSNVITFPQTWLFITFEAQTKINCDEIQTGSSMLYLGLKYCCHLWRPPRIENSVLVHRNIMWRGCQRCQQYLDLRGYLHVPEKCKDDIFSRDPFLEQFHRVPFYSETYNLDSNDTRHKCMLKIIMRNDGSMDRHPQKPLIGRSTALPTD